MKKQTKVLTVLFTAMLMAAVTLDFFPTTSTAYAEGAGWSEENGNWYYYNSYGDAVAGTWKKSGDDWYYLDSSGVRITNMQVNEYYVGEDGRRVSMKWVSVKNEDFWGEEDAQEYLYYYYGRDDRTLASKWASISNRWYYFNENGIMQTGSIIIDGYDYCLDEDGNRETDWVLLEDEIGNPEILESWYYFDNTGKRTENEMDEKIEGDYYTFVDGHIQTGWFRFPISAEAADEAQAAPSEATPAQTEATVAGYQCHDEDGKRADGWRTAEDVKGISEEAEFYRFYFRKGKPYHTIKGLELFSVDSKEYMFNTEGEMQTNKQVINIENDAVASFYFDEEGIMKTGKQVVYDEDLGETQNWYFHIDGSRKGQGYHGIKDNVLYIYGLRQEANKDLHFAPITLDDKQYLVNADGTVQKAGSSSRSSAKPELGNGFKDFRDENEKIWTVNTKGVVQ